MWISFLIVATFLTPLLELLIRHKTMHLLRSLLLLFCTGFTLMHLLPEIYFILGWKSILVFAVGMLVPSGSEKWVHFKTSKIHRVSSVFIVLGFWIHATMDGFALKLVEERQGLDGLHVGSVAIPLVLHRVPGSYLFARICFDHFSKKLSWFFILGFAVFTLVGYGATWSFKDVIADHVVYYFVAFVGGTLTHVSFHHFMEDHH